jgi:hypothetical protein
VDCGTNWTQQQIEAAIRRGSAKIPAARKALVSEAYEKVKGGYEKIITSIKHAIPAKLKISPVSMIPHKSCLYHCILNLSFNIN